MAKRHPYYNYSYLMSYNGAINLICGARGLGKTYGAVKNAIRKAIRTKGQEQFIYLRRYKEELKLARATFFNAVEVEFPKHDFRVQGFEAQYAPMETRGNKGREWFTMGYFFALSTAQSTKSVSFNKVRTVIFDEFIIEKGATHYLPDETTILLNFYNTVDRNQDKTVFLLLANSVSINNPYMIKWDIQPDDGKEIVVRGDGFIVCHFPDAADFQNSVYQTRFGRFIQGTEYGDYAVGNDFKDNHTELLNVKSSKAKYQFSLETDKGTFSVWREPWKEEYHIQGRLPKVQRLFTLVPERMSADKKLVTHNEKMMQILRTAFRSGNVTFDRQPTRNAFIEIFTR